MLRVALISPLYESVPPKLYGGTERVVYNLARGLTEAHIEVTVFASGDSCVEGKLVPVIEESLRLSPRRIRDPNAYNLKLLAQVAKQADEFDVIHNHHDYWMLPLSDMTNRPLVTTLHGQMDLPDIDAAFTAFPRAHYVSISDAQRKPMPQLNWLRTIHHGIDTDLFQFRERPGKYLAFLGRISVEKRPDWAIQMAKLSGVPLKIAAKIEGKENEDYYKTHVKPHVDGKNIEYVGEISESEKSDFLGNALAMTFPIDWPEPFGLVMIESLACGTPVLARPCGAAPEVLRDGVTGFVHADVRELAKRIRDIPKISRRKCREWVERNFSLRRMTEDYIHVYRHLVDFTAARIRTGTYPQGYGLDRHRRYLLHPVERVIDGNT
jgi:glycosyltransferase involved in cell wall biosynthesis